MCKIISCSLHKRWFDLHLGETQRVVVAFPRLPVHTVSVRRVVASQVGAVQVAAVT